ncbi:hypothetical protein HDE_13880 [Halotydeus destructor]|nr:hypothetical protein HDE_13880 [Halotydeus destructor]
MNQAARRLVIMSQLISLLADRLTGLSYISLAASCNYYLWADGCPPNAGTICNGLFTRCLCKPGSNLRFVGHGGFLCLPYRAINQSCYLSDQCRTRNATCLTIGALSSFQFNDDDMKHLLMESALEVDRGTCTCKDGYSYHADLWQSTKESPASALEQSNLDKLCPPSTGCCLPIRRFTEACTFTEECTAVDMNSVCSNVITPRGHRRVCLCSQGFLYDQESQHCIHRQLFAQKFLLAEKSNNGSKWTSISHSLHMPNKEPELSSQTFIQPRSCDDNGFTITVALLVLLPVMIALVLAIECRRRIFGFIDRRSSRRNAIVITVNSVDSRVGTTVSHGHGDGSHDEISIREMDRSPRQIFPPCYEEATKPTGKVHLDKPLFL